MTPKLRKMVRGGEREKANLRVKNFTRVWVLCIYTHIRDEMQIMEIKNK